jgi:hypothetical protein
MLINTWACISILPDLKGILPDAEVAASDETEEAKEFHPSSFS